MNFDSFTEPPKSNERDDNADQTSLSLLRAKAAQIQKNMANAHYELTTPLGSRVHLPDELDKAPFYQAVALYLANPLEKKPLLVQVNDPSVSYFVHHAAMTAGLLPTPGTDDAFDGTRPASVVVTDPETEIFNMTIPRKRPEGPAPVRLSYPRIIALHKGYHRELDEIRREIVAFSQAHSRNRMASTAPVLAQASSTQPAQPAADASAAPASPTPSPAPSSSSSPSGPGVPRLDLAPAPAPMRYAARVLARDYGMVGQSEGIGLSRHTVLWGDVDKQSIDARLRAFANAADSDGGSLTNTELVFPPMSGELRRFTAVAASDLGLVARSKGAGKDRHPVVFRRLPEDEAANDRARLERLYRELPRHPDGQVYVSDVADAVANAGLPSLLVPEAVADILSAVQSRKGGLHLRQNAPEDNAVAGSVSMTVVDEAQTIPLDKETFIAMVGRKESQLRALFNAFDAGRTGRIRAGDVKRAMTAANLVTHERDDALLAAIQQRCARAGEEGLTYTEFRDFLSLASPAAIENAGEHFFRASSSGFQSRPTLGKPSSSPYFAFCSALSGGLANAFSRTVVAPLERVRLQMSVDPVEYPGLLTTVRKIYQKEGIRGFWRGNVLNIIRIMPQGAISFFTKDSLRDAMPDPLRSSSLGLALSSMASGVMCMTAVHPLDMVRGQMTTSPGLYPNWHSGLRTTYQRDGVRGLYKGGSHSAIWAAVYYGVQFFSYDTIKAEVVRRKKASGLNPIVDTPTSLVLGGISGSLCVAAAYPLELVRRKLQVQGLGGRPVKYSGFYDCAKQVLLKEGGVGAFYKGLGPNILKTLPSVAITFGAYETLMNDLFHASKL